MYNGAMKKFLPAALFALVAALAVPFASAQAATITPPPMTGNEAIDKLTDGMNAIGAAKFVMGQLTTLGYEDENPFFALGIGVEGSAQPVSDMDGLWDSKVKATQVVQDDDGDEASVKANFVTKDGTYYVQFTNPENRAMRNKWIAIPAGQYESFAEEIDMAELFDLAKQDNGTESRKDAETFRRLAKLHNVFVEYQDPTVRRVKGKRQATYYYEYNRDTIASYFMATGAQNVIDGDEPMEAEFIEALKDDEFLDGMVERSFMSVTFDYATGRPIELTRRDVLPAFGEREEDVEVLSTMMIEPLKRSAKIKAPRAALTAEEFIEMFK